MNKKIVIAILGVCFFATIAWAEIGAPMKSFGQSKFYKSFGFSMDTSVDAGVFSTTPGKEKIIFLSKGRRCTVELVADKKSEVVSAQELNYPFSANVEDAERDKKCALLFFNEATGSKTDEKIFMKLYEEAQNHEGVVQKKESGGFFISVVVFRHALYKEWNILIEGQDK